MRETMKEPIGRRRVVKKLEPTSRGAIWCADQSGNSVICVRHRIDAKARVRHATVELAVSRVLIKARVEKLVGVRIDRDEDALQRVVRVAGARWDESAKLWRMPKRLARILRLSDRGEPE